MSWFFNASLRDEIVWQLEVIWDNAHAATLEDYRLFEKMEYDGETIFSLFHPEVQF